MEGAASFHLVRRELGGDGGVDDLGILDEVLGDGVEITVGDGVDEGL